MEDLTQEDLDLVEVAKKTAEAFFGYKSHGHQISCVGAALRSVDGKIYTGPNIHIPNCGPSSICAEVTILAKAYSENYHDVDSIVAFAYGEENGNRVVPPCGKCRDFMKIFGNPWVILQTQQGLKKARLTELLPESQNWWK